MSHVKFSGMQAKGSLPGGESTDSACPGFTVRSQGEVTEQCLGYPLH